MQPTPASSTSIPWLPTPGTAGIPAWVWQVAIILAAIYVALTVLGSVLPQSWPFTQWARRVATDLRALFGKGGEPPTPPPPAAAAILLGLALATTQMGCSLLTPKRVDSAADAAACVLLNRELPAEQIAVRCGLQVLDVFKIAKAQDQAFAKQMAAKKCGAP